MKALIRMYTSAIEVVKEGYLVIVLGYFFLFLHKKQGAPNEYSQYGFIEKYFLWGNKKHYP